jgi:diguanylate cyclase
MKDFVGLGFRRPGATSGTAGDTDTGLADLVDRLLRVLADLVPDSEIDDTNAFVEDLEQYREQLREVSTKRDVASLAEACLATCERYLSRSRRYIAEREAELTELIRILREAIALLTGGSTEFNTDLISASDRFGQLAQLDDIRELKRLLLSEVSTMRQVVEDKQRRDDETYANLSMRVEVLQMKLTKAEEEASLDALTRVPNRRSFDRMLRRMTAHARQSKVALTLAMLDIDSFKQINDTHGHPIGDRVLLCAAMRLGKSLRQSDFVARYGGEEFAVILNDATLDEVESRLTRVVTDIGSRSFEYDAGAETRSVRFTLSCGATELAAGDSDEDLLKRADDALYEAKRKGRGLVVTKKRSRLARRPG